MKHYREFITQMEKDQEFVEYIVKALVDNPADVRTDRAIDSLGCSF
jgi:hypothetical protein